MNHWELSGYVASPEAPVVRVRGRATPPPVDGVVRWSAAAPAGVSSFSATGMPHASAEQAAHGSSAGLASAGPGGRFEFSLPAPNRYYVPGEEHPVPAVIHLEWNTKEGRETRQIAAPGRPAYRSLRPICHTSRSPTVAEDYGDSQYARLLKRAYDMPAPAAPWAP